MDVRCPTSKYLGVARLKGYKWIISESGYANVVELKSKSQDSSTAEDESDDGEEYKEEVFGLVYSLQPKDEAHLDINEGVPVAYTKEYLTVDFWHSKDGKKVNVGKDRSVEAKMLVYINRERVKESKPKKEYIVRMASLPNAKWICGCKMSRYILFGQNILSPFNVFSFLSFFC